MHYGQAADRSMFWYSVLADLRLKKQISAPSKDNVDLWTYRTLHLHYMQKSYIFYLNLYIQKWCIYNFWPSSSHWFYIWTYVY